MSCREKNYIRLAPIAVLIGLLGCASSSQDRSVADLRQTVTEQEKRLTRINEKLGAIESTQRYLQEQHEQPGAPAQGGTSYNELSKCEVRFATDRYDLTTEACKEIDRLAEQLVSDPYSIVEVKGYTDGVGTPEHNFGLSELRAEAVARYLNTKFGIPLYRLTRMWYGEELAASQGRAEQDDPSSRRVEVRALSNSASRSSRPSLP